MSRLDPAGDQRRRNRDVARERRRAARLDVVAIVEAYIRADVTSAEYLLDHLTDARQAAHSSAVMVEAILTGTRTEPADVAAVMCAVIAQILSRSPDQGRAQLAECRTAVLSSVGDR